VNDLDLSSSHMDRLVKDILSSSTISQNFLDDESGNVKAYISGLLELIPRFQSIQKARLMSFLWHDRFIDSFTGWRGAII